MPNISNSSQKPGPNKPVFQKPASPLLGGKAPAKAEDYTKFHLPNGITADPALEAEFSALAHELGLSSSDAQRLVDLHASRVVAGNQAHQSQWESQCRNDRECGGANLPRTVAVANRALDRFGTPEMKQALVETGMGSHPEFVRFIYRVGKALSEDGYVPATHGRTNKSYAETMYPSKSKE